MLIEMAAYALGARVWITCLVDVGYISPIGARLVVHYLLVIKHLACQI